jgi:hypothetical protein
VDIGITKDTTQTILFCHSNRGWTRMAQLQASRHGIGLIVARDGRDVMTKAVGEVRPDAIVLGNDLKNPSTDELVRMLNADPRLRGIPVIVVKGVLDSLGQLMKSVKPHKWTPFK